MPHELLGRTKSRDTPAARIGPPKGPLAFLVSAIRQGVIGTKRKPALAITTVAVPFKVTVWGEFAASSEIFRVAVRLPEAMGANVIANVQLAPAARVAGQVDET